MQFAKTPTLNKNILKKIKNLGFFQRRNQPFQLIKRKEDN